MQANYGQLCNELCNKIAITAAGNNGGLDSLLQEPGTVKKALATRGLCDWVSPRRGAGSSFGYRMKDVACSNGYPRKRKCGP